MKTLLITMATAATLIAGAASAASTSNAEGEVRVFNPNKQVLFGSMQLDMEPTAALGVSSNQVFTEQTLINGRSAEIRYTIEGGERNIISTSFRSSDR